MSRTVQAVDRTVVLLIGVLLAATGLLLACWYAAGQGWFTAPFAAPDRLDTTGVDTVTGAAWWPWALGAAGVLLVLLGLRWLAAHLPDRGVGRLRIAGGDPTGRLEADAGSVTDAAADALARTEGVQSARGRLRRERGQLVATIHATVERGADLEVVAHACDQVSSDLAQVLGRDDVRCSVRLQVAHRDRALPRVA